MQFCKHRFYAVSSCSDTPASPSTPPPPPHPPPPSPFIPLLWNAAVLPRRSFPLSVGNLTVASPRLINKGSVICDLCAVGGDICAAGEREGEGEKEEEEKKRGKVGDPRRGGVQHHSLLDSGGEQEVRLGLGVWDYRCAWRGHFTRSEPFLLYN